MSSIVISGDTSGSITLAAPAVSGSNTATLPAATGTVMVSGNMPAFSAYQSSGQTLTSSVYTKLQFQTEEFDTNNNFDNATNYRFTPTVAGYYQVNGCVILNGATLTSDTLIVIYRNGSAFKRGNYTQSTATSLTGYIVSALIYFNGSTDFIELYGYASGISLNTTTGLINTYFQASMVRAA